MPSWTHLVRFVAVEDSKVHLGQLVDTTRDVGRDSANGLKIAVFVIEGTIFDGRVTKEIMHVKQVRFGFALCSPLLHTQFLLILVVTIPCLTTRMQLHSLLGSQLYGSCRGMYCYPLISALPSNPCHTTFLCLEYR